MIESGVESAYVKLDLPPRLPDGCRRGKVGQTVIIVAMRTIILEVRLTNFLLFLARGTADAHA